MKMENDFSVYRNGSTEMLSTQIGFVFVFEDEFLFWFVQKWLAKSADMISTEFVATHGYVL